jgi:hypothetical protein
MGASGGAQPRAQSFQGGGAAASIGGGASRGGGGSLGGGGGSIGAEFVFRAPADGYTLLLATNTHVINHVLLKNLPFDYTKDFAPLGLVTSTATMLAVTPSIKATNLKELTDILKAAPGKYQYSACNMASPQHFSMEMYKHALSLRKELDLGNGSFDWVAEFTNESTLGYRNGGVLVIHNFGPGGIEIPSGVVIASSQNDASVGLEPDQTVWLQTE